MLRRGFEVVSECNCGGEEGDTACYSCLCNYYNQRQHDILKRKYAIAFFRQIAPFYDEKWRSSKKEEPYNVQSLASSVDIPDSDVLKLIPQNKGQLQNGLAHDAIWDNIYEDCSEEELPIVQQMAGLCHQEPDLYSEVYKIEKTGESFCANLVWTEKKVFLFLADYCEDYEIAKKTGWKCICTVEQDAIEQFKGIGD